MYAEIEEAKYYAKWAKRFAYASIVLSLISITLAIISLVN